jgi:hypothetical protein
VQPGAPDGYRRGANWGRHFAILCFSIIKFVDNDRFSPPQLVNDVSRQPTGLRDAEITARGDYDRHARNFGCLPEKIDDSQALFIVIEVQVVPEQHGAAIAGDVREKIARRAVEADDGSQRQPAPRHRATRTQNDNLRLSGYLLGKVFQHSRFSDARIAPDFDIAPAVESHTNLSDPLLPCQHHAAHAIADVAEGAEQVGQASAPTPRAPTLGLLALGSPGLSLWRRKESEDSTQ